MKNTLLIITALAFSINLRGQVTFNKLGGLTINELGKTFEIGVYEKEGYKFAYGSRGNTFYEKEETQRPDYKKTDTVSFILRELDLPGRKLIKEIPLNHYHMDGVSIHTYHLGLRKFLIIRSRYSFLIVNLANAEVIGPITPSEGSDELQDAISGNLGKLLVFDNGQYLLADVRDLGLIGYNLRDLKSPQKISRFAGYKTYFFLDQTGANMFDGIFISRADFKPYFLFRSGQLNQTNDSTTVQILDKRYLALDTDETVVVDTEEGVLIHKEQFSAQLKGMSKDAGLLVVTLDNAWVRDAPTDGKVMMKLPLGSICEVLSQDKQETIRGRMDYWYKIRYQDQEGYIFGSQTSVGQKK